MRDEDSKHYLLEQDEPPYPRPQRRSFLASRGWIVASVCIILTSLIFNVFLYFRTSEGVGKGLSPYTGLASDKPYTYKFFTEWWTGENENTTQEEDELWDKLDIKPIAVLLSSEYVKEHNLEESSPFPWDPEKSVYYIKVYHHFHCFKIMRYAFGDLLAGRKSTVHASHVYHCLDALRQDAMCRLDDTPMPMPPGKGNIVGDGQQLMCRDFDKLNDWILAPERDACYEQIDNYRSIPQGLERFAFCKEDSPYYPVMKEYFEMHGHKDPFEKSDE